MSADVCGELNKYMGESLAPSEPSMWDRKSLELLPAGEYFNDQLAELEGRQHSVPRRTGLCSTHPTNRRVLHDLLWARRGQQGPGQEPILNLQLDRSHEESRDASLSEMGGFQSTSRVDSSLTETRSQ